MVCPDYIRAYTLPLQNLQGKEVCIFVKKVVLFIDMINEKIARFFSYLAILLVVQLVYEVFCRYVLNKPNLWSFDATYFISSIMLIFGLAYTWKKGGHVSVDLISAFLPNRVRALVTSILLIALFFTTWGLIANSMFGDAVLAWARKQKAASGSMPPVYPYKTWMLLGVFTFLLQGLSQLIRNLSIAITGKDIITGQSRIKEGGVEW